MNLVSARKVSVVCASRRIVASRDGSAVTGNLNIVIVDLILL